MRDGSWAGPVGESLAARRYREIIGCPAYARQRKVPPLLRIVHKTLPCHCGDKQVAPAALLRGDRASCRMRLPIGTIVTGAHFVALLRHPHLGGHVVGGRYVVSILV